MCLGKNSVSMKHGIDPIVGFKQGEDDTVHQHSKGCERTGSNVLHYIFILSDLQLMAVAVIKRFFSSQGMHACYVLVWLMYNAGVTGQYQFTSTVAPTACSSFRCLMWAIACLMFTYLPFYDSDFDHNGFPAPLVLMTFNSAATGRSLLSALRPW